MGKSLRLYILVGSLVISFSSWGSATPIYPTVESWETALGGNFTDVDLAGQTTPDTLIPAGQRFSLPSGKTLTFNDGLVVAQTPTGWKPWPNTGDRVLIPVSCCSQPLIGTFSAPCAVLASGLSQKCSKPG